MVEYSNIKAYNQIWSPMGRYPMVDNSIFETYEEALNFATTNSVAVVGNIIAVTNDEDGNKNGAYWLTGENPEGQPTGLQKTGSDLLIELTHSELKTLRDNNNLISGIKYRITDYGTSTFAGHQFDIIVEATSNNALSENAKACLHNGDTYFSNNDLDSWELKYCIDNEDARFGWANDKGVVYYMKDEFGNEAHYDFKNILFDISTCQYHPSFQYAYTFTDPNGNDLSLTANARNNIIKKYTDSNGVHGLNGTVFVCNKVHNNILEENNLNNLFWVNSCYYNTFGRAFQNNLISSSDGTSSIHNNVIGTLFKSNKITASFNRNYIGNTTTSCNFYSSFAFNSIGSNSYYVDFNYPVSYCTFGSYLQYCIFNNYNQDPTPVVSEMKWCTIEDGLEGAQYFPSCERVHVEQRSLYNTNNNFFVSDINLIDGTRLIDVLTSAHDDTLYVSKTEDGHTVFRLSDIKQLKQTSIIPIKSDPTKLTSEDFFNSTSNNGNYYGYVGTLENLGVSGDNILIDSISAYVGEGSPNKDLQVYCRLAKYNGSSWEVIYQSKECKSIASIEPETLFTFKIYPITNDDGTQKNQLLKITDRIAVLYVTNKNAPASSSGGVGIQLRFKSIARPGALNGIFNGTNAGDINICPAIVFSYLSEASNTGIYDLGQLNSMDQVNDQCNKVELCTNPNINKYIFRINNDSRKNASGYVEQFITGGPYNVDGQNYYYVVQLLHFDGQTSSRQIVYKKENNVNVINNITGWVKYIDHDDSGAPVLHSKGSEVVNLNSQQTISAYKTFNSGISIAGKTTIDSNIDAGELKFYPQGSNTNKGVIIRSANRGDNIPTVQILATNNSSSYTYDFPKKSGTVALTSDFTTPTICYHGTLDITTDQANLSVGENSYHVGFVKLIDSEGNHVGYASSWFDNKKAVVNISSLDYLYSYYGSGDVWTLNSKQTTSSTIYATKDYINEQLGDINSILESIIGKRLINFTIDNVTLQAEEGMTWMEFVYSTYNTANIIITKATSEVYMNDKAVCNSEHDKVGLSDVITNGNIYTLL